MIPTNFQLSLYPHFLSERNKLDREIRHVPSIAVVKKKLLSKIFSHPKSVSGVHDPRGLSYLSQLRVGVSKWAFTNSSTIHGLLNTQCALQVMA